MNDGAARWTPSFSSCRWEGHPQVVGVAIFHDEGVHKKRKKNGRPVVRVGFLSLTEEEMNDIREEETENMSSAVVCSNAGRFAREY